MKPRLKNRNDKSAYVKIISDLLLTDKEEFRRYLRLNTIDIYHSIDHVLICIHWLVMHFVLLILIHHALITTSYIDFYNSQRFSFLHKNFSITQLEHSHKKWNSLEIWAVKLRFLLMYKNMLKSIATVRGECTAKHKSKASYNTDYIFPDLIEFIWRWLKSDQNADWKNKYLYL